MATGVSTTTQNYPFGKIFSSSSWLSRFRARSLFSSHRSFYVVAHSTPSHKRGVRKIQSSQCTDPTSRNSHTIHKPWGLMVDPRTKLPKMVPRTLNNHHEKLDEAVIQVSGNNKRQKIFGTIASQPKICSPEKGWEQETTMMRKEKEEIQLALDKYMPCSGKGSDPISIYVDGTCTTNTKAPAPENVSGHQSAPFFEIKHKNNSNIDVKEPNYVEQKTYKDIIENIGSLGPFPRQMLGKGQGTESNVNGKVGIYADPENSRSETSTASPDAKDESKIAKKEKDARQLIQEKLSSIYSTVHVVDNISDAKEVVKMLTGQFRNLVHACDTEVSKIDVKQETPVNHGELICFSIYSGPKADFGNGKSCIWVDVLDGGGRNLLNEFAPFFEDPSIKKVWHNYSFDNHILENYGIKMSGFHADTMHMARLWDSSRRMEGGYSLEALTGDATVMSKTEMAGGTELIGKISMKTIFGKKKLKKDGSEGKLITIAPVEELQREERISWISYSASDAINTLELYDSLKGKLSSISWNVNGNRCPGEHMFNFYEKHWRPFGELLVRMEAEGMLVDRKYLAEVEKIAKAEQEIAANRFRSWASKYCPDAKYMNVGSDAQLRQLFFAGCVNSKNGNESMPSERVFKVPNIDQVVEEGKKTAGKYRSIKLHGLDVKLDTDMYTASGWPSVSGDALKVLAGKVSAEYDFIDDACDPPLNNSPETSELNTSSYGTAFKAFGEGKKGREACHAIASLCEVCSIDSLISNFILPLQGTNVSGKNGHVHCSLNINTETGRLSARRPNLQNQPALEKDRYKIRQAFIASPGNSLIVADYGQLELRLLAHLANCKSMLDAFKAGGDFHSRTAMNMYPHICEAIRKEQVLLEWHPQPGEEKPPVPLLKDAYASERRKAKMLNFSIAYGKTPIGLSRDWKVSVEEAQQTVDLWYKERQEVLKWQEARKEEARTKGQVFTLLGRTRRFPNGRMSRAQRRHIERAAINTPVQGSAADVAMCAMLEISKNAQLKELGWKLLLQVHDEVILEGPSESAEIAKDIVVECMSKPFDGENILRVGLSVDAKCAQNWYAAK